MKPWLHAFHENAMQCAAGVLLFLAGTVTAAGAGNISHLSGWLLGRVGYRLNTGHHRYVLNQQLLQLQWKPPSVKDWRLEGIAWAEHENALEPGTTAEVTLRELTARKETSRYALTFGRQIVVWGKADGFRLLDIVNPLDLREFVLGDEVRRRIPLWMADMQFFPDEYRRFTSSAGLPYLKQDTTLRALLGIDWYAGNWLISPQFYAVEADGAPAVPGDPDGRFGSMLLEHKFYYDKATVRAFAASDLTRRDYWISLSLRYQWFGNLELSVTGDWLGGEPDGVFGQFGNRDRIIFSAKVFTPMLQ